MIPINVDRNVSPADYRAFGNKLLVTSTFYTVQGEGPLGGHPAVFLRLAGCNIGAKLDCPWCDTRFHYDDGELLTVPAALSRILDVADGRTNLVVVTGGEPLLQWEAMLRLITIAPRWTFQFETNGYYLRGETFSSIPDWIRHRVSFVVSPKMPHGKTDYPKLRDTEWTLGAVSMKYVVDADPDSPYHTVPALRPMDTTIYVSGVTVYKRSPEPGEVPSLWDTTLIDLDATGRNYRHAASIVAARGEPYRLSYQTHLLGALE